MTNIVSPINWLVLFFVSYYLSDKRPTNTSELKHTIYFAIMEDQDNRKSTFLYFNILVQINTKNTRMKWKYFQVENIGT